ncbi:MAG: antitoxin family protein [Calothrix sp. SM1_7_51]|nr:antitoxin family protein [Calothrix sp. SM1_7_51]
MPQVLKAVYRNGKFIPQTSCNLPEGSEVELLIQSAKASPPPITDPVTKQRFLSALVERMQQNPIPANAPVFTRDMLPVTKKIVTDEAMRPVAVLIDYQDWQKIEKILKNYQPEQQADVDLNQFAGIIKLTQDPLEYQQQVRDEWS